MLPRLYFLFFFFFNDTATTEIYTLSLHDALPISFAAARPKLFSPCLSQKSPVSVSHPVSLVDRKSTRLNSSHSQISYAVFCLKKKKNHVHYSASLHLWTHCFLAVYCLFTDDNDLV